MMAAAERQAEWQRARDKQMQLKSEALRLEEEKEHTFKPQLATKRRVTPRGKPPQKTSGLIAHDLHVRRYAKARDDKERAAAALTWSSPSTQSRRRSTVDTLCPSDDDDRDDDDDDDDLREESFFAQLQRERKQWDSEHAKLLTVIELQQRELRQRGIIAEDKAREIARHFADSVANFEDRVVKIETDVSRELVAIRQLLADALPQLAKVEALENQVKALTTKLDALRLTPGH